MAKNKYQLGGKSLVIFDEELDLDIQDVAPGERKVRKYSNGAVQMEQYMLEGLLHGPVTVYSTKSKPLAESWFVRGQRQGRTCLYYLSGALYAVEKYRNSAKHGLQEYYYENGSKKTEVFFEDGRQVGEAKLWDADGKLMKRELALSAQ